MPKLVVVLVALTLVGCASAAQHHANLPSNQFDGLTVGTVQREIHKGMSGADVIVALGAPNIVTRDSDGRETWVWDKMHTDSAYSKSEGGVTALVLGGGNTAAGGSVVGASGSAGASSSSQRTLTVIIKFVEGVVDEFTYHSSSF